MKSFLFKLGIIVFLPVIFLSFLAVIVLAAPLLLIVSWITVIFGDVAKDSDGDWSIRLPWKEDHE